MGLIGKIFRILFGDGRNVITETAGAFRPNAEAQAARSAASHDKALAQFSAEFAKPQTGLFDRLIDGLNRLPRPLLAFGTLGLFVSAMVDPIWFASRMQGVALVPEPLWWLMGAIVSFYFGARYQTKAQDFQRSITGSLQAAGQVTRNLRALDALGAGASATQQTDPAIAAMAGANPALQDWRAAANG